MEPIDQRQALGEDALADGDRAHFWRSPGHGDLECLSARFQRHRHAVAGDRAAAAGFVAAHRALASGDDALADEQLVAALGRILIRHADVGPPLRLGRERGPVDRVRAYIEDHHADAIDLATLAGVAGLSRFHLVRAFRKETGLTPLAWLTDARVRAGRRLLAAGGAPGEVAAACGFADPSHLTRAFKARVGVTPGAFRAALHGRRSARAA